MIIDDLIKNAKSVAIFGHVRPDGDCVGSTCGIYGYIKSNFECETVDLFLENFPESYKILTYANESKKAYDITCNNGDPYDLVFLMDTPSFERVGANGVDCIKNAKHSINIDHHISNQKNLCHTTILCPDSSSASEVLYSNLNPELINKEVANSIYLGIVHDTGAFKFSSTKKRTMEIVGALIEKGIDFSKIINETYYTRTFNQSKITGYVLEHAFLSPNKNVIYAYVTQDIMDKFNVTPVDLGNVIDTLREVEKTEVAIFLYPVKYKFKISLRSNYVVDVNKIAKEFGGGGHTRAAGADTTLDPETAIKKILEMIRMQIN